ncbi:MBL fold metallo-hydrolase [Clostridium sp.]|uniref:MBL fold metallo-hydrolase n=1 Tax=Clostridium sp. TaxID=1506 RepID=UPI002FDDA930
MDTWFTIEKIDDSTYSISEYGHWEKVHSYLIIGEKSACLIDTGLGIGNIKEVTDSLTSLPIKVITTHVHWDHIGGHKYYEDIYVHKGDSTWLEEGIPIPLNVIKNYVIKPPITKPFPKNFDINKYTIYKGKASHVIEDGYVVSLGNRELQIIYTPGHSPGHVCIHDKSS